MYSEEELLEEIRRVSREELNGKRPTGEEFDEFAFCSHHTCKLRFDGWSGALKEAGFEPRRYKYTDEEILNKVKDFINEYGRFSMGKWDRDSSYPSKIAFYNHFNSTEDAFDILNIDNSHHSRNDLVEEMERMVNKLDGETPKPSYVTEKSHYALNSFRREFGSWTDALEECGYEPRRQRGFSRSDLIEDFKRISKLEGCSDKPRIQDVTNYSRFGFGTYKREFGSWNEVLKAAGMEPKSAREWVISGEEHYAWKGGEDNTYYGPSWWKQRKKAWKRDNYRCRVCYKTEKEIQKKPSVHHIKPRKKFDIQNEHKMMNRLENLVSLCAYCHKNLEGKWVEANPKTFIERGKRYIHDK